MTTTETDPRKAHASAEYEAGALDAEVVDLEQRLLLRREAKADAERESAELAKAALKRQHQLERDANGLLKNLERELADAIATPLLERPTPRQRLSARCFLYAGDENGDQLRELTSQESVCGALYSIQRRAAQLMDLVGAEVRPGVDHPLVAAADDLECRCWDALLKRARRIGGESSP